MIINESYITKQVNEIETAVYEHIKPHGFKKFGRTLHRFVSGDISQVINFQSAMPYSITYGTMCVNTGIRVPESFERTFNPSNTAKKYYHEYECNIRSRFGQCKGKKETSFDLIHKSAEKIADSIIKEADKFVLPAFDVLNSRTSILEHRKDFPNMDTLNKHLILLDECMIYGRMGEIDKAKNCFETYYKKAVDEYNASWKYGEQVYLKKGQSVIHLGKETVAEKDGYVTVYGTSHGHVDYLDELAKKLMLR